MFFNYYSIIILIGFVISNVAYWNEGTYPDPTTLTGYKACKVLKRSYLCDVDEVLSDKERHELNQILNEFPNQTIDVDLFFLIN